MNIPNDQRNKTYEWYVKLLDLFNKEANEANKEANSIFREISKQLILVSSLIVTISSVFFISDRLAKVSDTYKIIIIFSWIFLVISIVAGIIQFLIDHKFFLNIARQNSYISNMIADTKLGSEGNDLDKLLKDINMEQSKIEKVSCDIPFWFQIVTIFFSFILLIVALIKYIYT